MATQVVDTPPAMDADLDDGELWLLAQMNLVEEGGDSYRTSKIDPVNGNAPKPRPRSSSLPSPGKSLWSSWLGWGAGQALATATATARPYKYKPLLNKGDFRLLSVSKSGMGDQLYFQMTRQRMDDCPEYEAISYTWGSTECTEPIFHAFSGEVLFITKNCVSALQNIHTERRLWIDAICINQNDVEERNVQVSMMADVFRNANRTIAYVGESDRHSKYLTLSPVDRSAMRDADRRLGFLTPSSYEYLHVDAVATRPWFSRTWVIQEVLLSKNLSMQAGKDVMDFQEICAILRKHGTDPNKWVPGITNTFIRYGSESQVKTRLLKHFAAGSPGPASPDLSSKGYLKYWQLFNLLFETAPYQCRDARDKLFALTSLFDGDPPEELRPDYSLDTGEVYANISRFLIMSENITLALSAAHGVGSASDIPSWAIDWRDAPLFKALTQGMMGDRTQYSAGFYPPAARHQQHVPIVPSTGKVLRLRGLRTGVIYEPMHTNLKPKISWLDHSKDMFYRAEPVESESWSLPKKIRSGDVIVILFGFEVPFVLRTSQSRWLLIGECDVEDIMYGQALSGLGLTWDQIDSSGPTSPLEDFDII